jgi:peptidyl-prolyl cis-trans isomerase SurA
VRQRFGPEARPSDSEIDARLLETGTEGGVRVLLNEILLPATDPATAAASRARAEELSRITDEAAFAEAAGRFSRAPTRIRGGELDWLPLSSLPPAVQPTVGALAPGQTSRPVDLGASIALFHMRDREQVRAAAPDDIAIDFVLLTLGSAEAAQRTGSLAQTCDDLYGAASGLPEDRLRRETLPEAQIPGTIRAILATLDRHETALLPDGSGTLVMLCGRQLDTEAALNRAAVAEELGLRRLGARAERLLAELRAGATITRSE